MFKFTLSGATLAAITFTTATASVASDVGLPIWDVPQIVIENGLPDIWCPQPIYPPIAPIYNFDQKGVYDFEPSFDWSPNVTLPPTYPIVCGCEYNQISSYVPYVYKLLGTDFAPFPLSEGYVTPDYPGLGDPCMCYGTVFPCVDPRIIYN